VKTAIITVAGISSRFNQGIAPEDHVLKAIFSEGENRQTLLAHLLGHCAFADRIIVVGGYRFSDLERYVEAALSQEVRDRITLIRNPHFEDLASGYSLYLGLEEALREEPEEVLFVEGDLDIDRASFQAVVEAGTSVLTCSNEPICASKAVVLYRDSCGRYRYAFNSNHGLLKIDEAFSVILNSGQLWKFRRMDALRRATWRFPESDPNGTNLKIIQDYLDQIPQEEVQILRLRRWTNCNTRQDYRRIRSAWEEEE